MRSLLGTVQILTVQRIIETGYVLTDGENEILLHANEAAEHLEENQQVDVFLYEDKKGQVVATMEIPTIRFDQYDWVEVVEVVPSLGVFVNIGIQKEMLVSSDDLPLFQNVWPTIGDKLYVKLDTDKRGRLIAKPATEHIFDQEREDAPENVLNHPISGHVYRTSREGSAIFTEEGYRGFIHQSERKEEPRLGQWVKGRIIDVKGDGTINVSLRPLKQVGMVEDADRILEHLESEGGVMPFSDKSDPIDIKDTFHISKAAFKRAMGKLMKEGKVEQRDGKTYLK
ncbi:CvfB family protein [Salirhabdus sp. Marseille-P4669]|uniref:CvfB family protein n=1 Tax=Salirhabdus sp. Marseille-P4669 TaxID=2042310 RepID=UPI000C7B82BD|nr:S1-like domain-containing RNA-binding protein [Salirhabdus sp. Marseille-P4669]